MIEERQHGDIIEHHHENYDYWHPITRVHKMEDGEVVVLPEGHVLAPVVPYTEEIPEPRGLQVQKFDWTAWDAGCHAKGICQGYHSIPVVATDCATHDHGQPCPGWSEESKVCTHSSKPCTKNELHHRGVAPDLQGIAEAYWQCPHCRPLQKPIQWAEGARLETYDIESRGNRTILWIKVSSGQWFVLVTYNTIQAVASYDCNVGTAYTVGNYPPQQMPDEIAVCLARRFWHKITKGSWSDVPKEE